MLEQGLNRGCGKGTPSFSGKASATLDGTPCPGRIPSATLDGSEASIVFLPRTDPTFDSSIPIKAVNPVLKGGL